MNKKDKYLVLFDLEASYSAAELKDAYRVLSKVWHPDRFTRNEKLRKKAENKTKEINQGYKYLKEQLRNKENLVYGSNRSKSSAERSKDDTSGARQNRYRTNKMYNTTPSFRPGSIFKWWILIPFMFLIFAVPLIPVLLHSEQAEPVDRTENHLQQLFELDRNEDDLAESYTTLQQGLEKYSQGEYREALYQVDLAINQNPKFARAYMMRGMINSRLGDETHAVRDFTYAIDLDHGEAFAYYGRGLIYKKNDQFRRAVADFDQAIRHNPDLPEMYVARGRVKYDVEDYQGAMNDFTRAIELNPASSIAYASRALARFMTQQFESAGEDFSRAAELGARIGTDPGLSLDNSFGDYFYNRNLGE
jgi:tetratricopeptide (TPR) repeat protein